MLFQRIFKILSATLHSPLREKEKQAADPTDYQEPERLETLDPLKVKEAEFYANLELRYGAGFAEIKEAYKKLMKQYHPDKFQQDEEQRKIAEAITTRLNEAYTYFEKKIRQNS